MKKPGFSVCHSPVKHCQLYPGNGVLWRLGIDSDFLISSNFIRTLYYLHNGIQNIPSGNYFPTGANSAAIASPSLTAFNGELSQGTWRLTISDNAASDIGSLGSWNLSVTGSETQSVPEPGSVLGLLAMGAMGAGSTLMRKKGQKSGDNHLN